MHRPIELNDEHGRRYALLRPTQLTRSKTEKE